MNNIFDFNKDNSVEKFLRSIENNSPHVYTTITFGDGIEALLKLHKLTSIYAITVSLPGMESPIGEARFTVHEEDCYIKMIETAVEYQDLGIGRTMMDCIKTFCAYKNIDFIYLNQVPNGTMKDRDGNILDTKESIKQLDSIYSSLGFNAIDPTYTSNKPYMGVLKDCIIDIDQTKEINAGLFNQNFFGPILNDDPEQ